MPQAIYKCPSCGEDLIRSYEDGKKKLRTSILIWGGEGGCICKCPSCKADAEIPVTLSIPEKRRRKIVHYIAK